MTSSVVRMLEMRSIDVEGRCGCVNDRTFLLNAAENVNGRTFLLNAAENGHLDICSLLIDNGAQVEVRDIDGWTRLHFAAIHGHIEIVRLLCDRGADVEACDDDEWRPLHWAAYHGHITVVKELIEERNAVIFARTNGGETALMVARMDYKPDVAAYLDSYGGIE